MTAFFGYNNNLWTRRTMVSLRRTASCHFPTTHEDVPLSTNQQPKKIYTHTYNICTEKWVIQQWVLREKQSSYNKATINCYKIIWFGFGFCTFVVFVFLLLFNLLMFRYFFSLTQQNQKQQNERDNHWIFTMTWLQPLISNSPCSNLARKFFTHENWMNMKSWEENFSHF